MIDYLVGLSIDETHVVAITVINDKNISRDNNVL
jgi:predicted small secreted protein